jgi:hypothetical protein
VEAETVDPAIVEVAKAPALPPDDARPAMPPAVVSVVEIATV